MHVHASPLPVLGALVFFHFLAPRRRRFVRLSCTALANLVSRAEGVGIAHVTGPGSLGWPIIVYLPRLIVYSPEVSWKQLRPTSREQSYRLKSIFLQTYALVDHDHPILASPWWGIAGTVSRGSTLLL